MLRSRIALFGFISSRKSPLPSCLRNNTRVRGMFFSSWNSPFFLILPPSSLSYFISSLPYFMIVSNKQILNQIIMLHSGIGILEEVGPGCNHLQDPTLQIHLHLVDCSKEKFWLFSSRRERLCMNGKRREKKRMNEERENEKVNNVWNEKVSSF